MELTRDILTAEDLKELEATLAEIDSRDLSFFDEEKQAIRRKEYKAEAEHEALVKRHMANLKAESDRIEAKIVALIGEEPTDRRERSDWRKTREGLLKLVKKYGERILTNTFVWQDGVYKAVKEDGTVLIWMVNNGVTRRSLSCGTLYMNQETIFTSGTLGKAIEYLIKG